MRAVLACWMVVVAAAGCRSASEPVAMQTCIYTDTIPATDTRPGVIITGYYSGAVCDSLRAQYPGRVQP